MPASSVSAKPSRIMYVCRKYTMASCLLRNAGAHRAMRSTTRLASPASPLPPLCIFACCFSLYACKRSSNDAQGFKEMVSGRRGNTKTAENGVLHEFVPKNGYPATRRKVFSLCSSGVLGVKQRCVCVCVIFFVQRRAMSHQYWLVSQKLSELRKPKAYKI